MPSLLLTMALLVLGACATGPAGSPIEERRVVVEESRPDLQEPEIYEDYTATPLEERSYQLEQAERYESLASGQPQAESIDAVLSAAEFYIQANDSERAEQTVLDLELARLNDTQRNRYQIIRGYAEYARGDNEPALARMQSLLSNPANLDNENVQQRVDALLLTSFIQQRFGQTGPALSALLERESLLYGNAKSETSRYIWQVLSEIPRPQREELIATTTNPQLRNRLEQSLSGQVGDPNIAPPRFDQWRDQASPEQQAKNVITSNWNEYSPRSIAVLLPESSRYQRAARAVRDGIEYQHQLNNSPFRPQLNFYDIGSEPWQVAQFYAAAEQRGTDLIIGPLGKDYANTLLQSMGGGVQTSTILLGGDLALGGAATRLDLSPEQESQAIAERALASGWVNAVVLAPTTASGERAARAFQDSWLRLGGKISKVVNYSPEQFDHSTEFKLMFDLNQSQSRYRALSDTLGYRPKFSPYRRNDIDFVYLIADAETGRIVRPQINFFGGNAMPVIAGANIYNGIESVAENMDLNNTVFPVMPWELTSQEFSPYAGQLNRLFALGVDAYQLAASLTELRRDERRAIAGNTGTLSIGNQGEIVRSPVWAVFREGKAVTDTELTPIDPLRNPLLIPGLNNRGAGRPQGRNSYNDSNWDSRESRRRSGS